MAKVYASLSSTIVDPTQYSIGQGQLYTRQVYDFLNMSNGGTLFYKSRVFKDANLIKNPLKRRYEEYENAKSINGSPYIGEKYNVYEKLGRQIVFLDDVGGLSGFTYNEGYSDLPNTEMKTNMDAALKIARHMEFRNGGKEYSDDKVFFGGENDTDAKFNEVYSNGETNAYGGTYNVDGLKNRIVQLVKDLFGNTDNLMDEDLLNENNKFNDKIGVSTSTNIENLIKKCLSNSKFIAINDNDYYSLNDQSISSNNFTVYPLGELDQLKKGKSIDQIINTRSFGETYRSQWSNYITTSQKMVSQTYSLYDERSENDSHQLSLDGSKDGPNDNYSEGTSLAKLSSAQGLLGKTNQLFNEGKIGSLINRFHTKSQDPNGIESAVDSLYGLSRGRNLRKYKDGSVNVTEHNGYDNPYCRVWTSHYQYSKMRDRIRPFVDESGNFKTLSEVQEKIGDGLRPFTAKDRLSKMSSLQNNGLPLIAPYDVYNSDSEANGNIDQSDLVKRCMFSIENLAWKDINVNASVNGTKKPVLTKEQQGPLGGRIMWFPPYNLKFTENVGVVWEGNNFIGRGEQIYTYTNTERSGTLNFTVLIDHPSIVNRWAKQNESTREKEEELLRFFAGCGELEVEDEKEVPVYDKKEFKTYTERLIEEPVPPLKDDTRLVVDPVPEVYQNFEKRFYVFFPNNLSGEDYIGNPRILEDYLFNGYNGTGGYEFSSGPVKGCIDTPEIVGKNRTYKYQVDKATVDQNLVGSIDNNQDTITFSLNDNFKTILEGGNEEQKKMLTDFFQLEGYPMENIMNFKDAENGLKSLITQEIRDKYDINVIVNGFASAHGGKVSTSNGKDDNKRLSRKRANYIISLLKDYNLFDPENIRFGENKTIPVQNKSINAFDAKAGRSAEVIITFTIKSDLTPESAPELDNTVYNWHLGGQLDGAVVVAEIPKKYRKEIQEDVQIVDVVKYEKLQDESSFDNEYLYFKKIGSEESLIKKNIVDKVKYFDPAFHSITPEGFNARLTFLHQCTRQGPTYSVADGGFYSKSKGNFAGNLAFGRPPVCVLRIGDFYNTKIIIDSLSIDYDAGGGVQWDLNPEGIGIQPMMANITIGFKFLGGSDLSGPIERLQNAVSSNFFANTSVYDRKADYRSEPIERGNELSKASKAWNASFITDSTETTHIDFNPE